MDRSRIIQEIGAERYAFACRLARQTAGDPQYGTQVGGTPFDSDIPHAIADMILNSSLTPYDQLQLILQLYDEMPCYAFLMYLKSYHERLIVPYPTTFWDWIRHQLETPDLALNQPVTYALWCDFFEDPQTVDTAWTHLMTPLPSRQALQTILIHSGPVPFPLKRVLYATLLPDATWHYFIFRSLLHTQFDVYGKLEKQEARRLVQRLELPADTEHVATLKQALGDDEPVAPVKKRKR